MGTGDAEAVTPPFTDLQPRGSLQAQGRGLTPAQLPEALPAPSQRQLQPDLAGSGRPPRASPSPSLGPSHPPTLGKALQSEGSELCAAWLSVETPGPRQVLGAQTSVRHGGESRGVTSWCLPKSDQNDRETIEREVVRGTKSTAEPREPEKGRPAGEKPEVLLWAWGTICGQSHWPPCGLCQPQGTRDLLLGKLAVGTDRGGGGGGACGERTSLFAEH